MSKEKEIVEFVGERTVSKKEIVAEFREYYGVNADSKIGTVLARLIGRGKLEKKRWGVYRRVSPSASCR